MRRERNVAFKADLFESLIDPQPFELPKELAIIDRLLDDERVLEPIRRKLTARRGRPTIPLETYLRMTYLKRRYRLGFEAPSRKWPTAWSGGASADCASPTRCPTPPPSSS